MTTKQLETKTFPTRIDIDEKVRKDLIAKLNLTLCTAIDLQSQLKQAHWNVKGPNFIQLHEMFDEFAGEITGYVDMMAERVTTLGGLALGTTRVAAANSLLDEFPVEATNEKEILNALADRYATFAKHIRKEIDATDKLGDADTADLYTEISRTIDMRLWFIESHLH